MGHKWYSLKQGKIKQSCHAKNVADLTRKEQGIQMKFVLLVKRKVKIKNDILSRLKGRSILNKKYNGGKTKCQTEIKQDQEVEVKVQEMDEEKEEEELVEKELEKKQEERKGIVNSNSSQPRVSEMGELYENHSHQ